MSISPIEWTEELDKDLVKRRKDQGESTFDISKALGINRKLVSARLRELGLLHFPIRKYCRACGSEIEKPHGENTVHCANCKAAYAPRDTKSEQTGSWPEGMHFEDVEPEKQKPSYGKVVRPFNPHGSIGSAARMVEDS